MKVQDIMTREVVSISSDTSVSEVATIMSKNRFHGVPVLEEGRLIGIITETDFYVRGTNIFLPSFITFLQDIDTVGPMHSKKKGFLKRVIQAKAKDIMTSQCITVDETMSLSDLLSFFQETNYHTLPVVDKDKKMIGIVTRTDLLKLISIQKDEIV
ncbi:MAG: CBS domain-containing protein [Candidatus Moraniibacteriota bacterium]|nr:MAG: CBS domain-containing protein [Candidatus Moranbacteria bacterium]